MHWRCCLAKRKVEQKVYFTFFSRFEAFFLFSYDFGNSACQASSFSFNSATTSG